MTEQQMLTIQKIAKQLNWNFTYSVNNKGKVNCITIRETTTQPAIKN